MLLQKNIAIYIPWYADLYKSHQKTLKLLCRRLLGNRMLIQYPISLQNPVGGIEKDLVKWTKLTSIIKQTNIKTPRRFDHCLEILTELKKAVITVTVYDSKDRDRIQQTERHRTKSTRNREYGTFGLLVQWTALNYLSNHVWQYVWRGCKQKKWPKPGCLRFWESVT